MFRAQLDGGRRVHYDVLREPNTDESGTCDISYTHVRARARDVGSYLKNVKFEYFGCLRLSKIPASQTTGNHYCRGLFITVMGVDAYMRMRACVW